MTSQNEWADRFVKTFGGIKTAPGVVWLLPGTERKQDQVSKGIEPNKFRGIAIYADPEQEMAKRNMVELSLSKATSKDRQERVDHFTRVWGRETVRAVVGTDGA
ncbi:MAG TPA: hypothetical protein VL494_13590 [Steroidobacteraceae bacterium]|nr:hypothetical protein [Steroidobacteraceae bacterium]